MLLFLTMAITLQFVSSSLSASVSAGLTLPIFNDLAHQRYFINLSVGTPPTHASLMLDTGSADLWLPLWNSSGCAPNPCKPGAFNPDTSSSAVDLGIPFNISYGLEPGAGWLGEYYNETVSLGGLELRNQTVNFTIFFVGN